MLQPQDVKEFFQSDAGKIMNLFKKVTLQVNTKCKIESRLVNINVSLLLKIARNIWDLKHDKGVMLGELVELHLYQVTIAVLM